ncbi:hypothetical protein DZC34_19980 [Clostridium botulinum]|nr:hypothetical protein DZC34_19980 [Clostridium botulinum]
MYNNSNIKERTIDIPIVKNDSKAIKNILNESSYINVTMHNVNKQNINIIITSLTNCLENTQHTISLTIKQYTIRKLIQLLRKIFKGECKFWYNLI